MASNQNNVFKRQKVLVIPSENVEHLYRVPKFHSYSDDITLLSDIIKKNGKFVDRQWAEDHDSVKQIIAYAIVRNNNSFLLLRRSNRGNRKTLRLRYTLLFGGHVDDIEEYSAQPLVDGLIRELNEEIGIQPSCTPTPLGIIADPSTFVGWLHLGVIFDARVSVRRIAIKDDLDNGEFVSPAESETYDLVEWEYIKKFRSRLDPWSRLFLSSNVPQELLNIPYSPPHEQMFLAF